MKKLNVYKNVLLTICVFLCFQSEIKYDSNDYLKLCSHFQLISLELRRKVTDMVFFHKILHSNVNCFSLVSSVFLHLPARRTRHTKVFGTSKRSRLLLRKKDFLPRCVTLANLLESVDFFDSNISQRCIKRIISEHLIWFYTGFYCSLCYFLFYDIGFYNFILFYSTKHNVMLPDCKWRSTAVVMVQIKIKKMCAYPFF